MVNPQTFLQQHLVGKWPLKFRVSLTYNNNIISKTDTISKYNPIDTLLFTADGKYEKRNKTVLSSGTYSVDESGENITFKSNTTTLTQKFNYVRNTSIGLIISETTTANGRVVIEDQLKKN